MNNKPDIKSEYFVDESTGQRYLMTRVTVIEGKAGGLSGTPQTQTASTLIATRQRLTFDPPIKGMSLEVVGGNGATDDDEACLFCVDAPNTLVADAWLTETNIAPRHAIKEADGIKEYHFDGDTITYVDLIAKGTTPDLDVTVVGVS